MEDSGTELQPILRSDDAIRESHPSSVLHAGADDFLRVGCMYTFNPVKALPHLVLHHALQPNSHPAFAIRRTSVLVVLNRTGTWRLITCAGYEGWVNISDDFAKTKAFIKCNSVARYQDWRGNNQFYLWGNLMLGSDGNYYFLTNVLFFSGMLLFSTFVLAKLDHTIIHSVRIIPPQYLISLSLLKLPVYRYILLNRSTGICAIYFQPPRYVSQTP